MGNLICICDDCRAVAAAGDPPFVRFGDLLDFDPVPRKKARADGWDADCQRAFIAALAVCGSKRQAAAAVGKAQFGVEQLLKHEGSEGFAAACDRAIALHAETERHRRVRAVGALAGEAERRRPVPAWSRAETRRLSAPPPPGTGPTEAEQEADDLRMIELLEAIVRKYMIKLAQERRCRLEGRIAEADFYCRQVTMLEVALDMLSGNGMELLKSFRALGHDLLTIAETPFSQLMDAARRDHWADQGDPPRPEYPPRHLLVEMDGFSVEPLEAAWGGRAESHEEQRRKFERQHAEDAAAQVEWEARARQEFESRRDSATRANS